MEDPQASRDKLLTDALQSYRDEYKELSDTWRHIEGKAQTTITVAGIFLAAVFAFVRVLTVGSPSTLVRLLLLVAVLLLIIAVILAVLALRVRTVQAPPLGESIKEMIVDLSRVSDPAELQQRLPRFVEDQLGLWEDANTETHESNNNKASLVSNAQKVLLAALVLVAIMTGCVIMTDV